MELFDQILLSKCSDRTLDATEVLRQWNDWMDEAFSNPTELFDYKVMESDDFLETCSSTCLQLKYNLLACLFNADADAATTRVFRLFNGGKTADNMYLETSVETAIRRVKARTNQPSKLDLELVRCAQNLMRWYIQIVLRNSATSAIIQMTDALKPWKEVNMLQLCLDLMDVAEMGRFSSQLFFYATFPALPHDQYLIESMKEIARQNLAERLLKILAQTGLSEERWLLSLVRNIHNAVAGFPEQCLRHFEQASVSVENSWVGGDGDRCTYPTLLREIGIAIFESNESLSNLSVELVVEILRCCFALRLGSKLLDQRWRLFIDLCLNSEHYICQNATVSILVDAPKQYSLDSDLMLRIIGRQLRDTNSGLIDDSDAAAIIPILAVLHKFCVASPEFRRSMRDGIFTDEESYQLALEREVERTGNSQARNSRPLDAPKGTLRSNLMLLMTCPHGIVKRLACELLWSVLDGQKDDFVRRVGLGNALPFLTAKGLAKLPV